jgi:phosphoglycerol transferase MdoB-like AlkP superfamily enzyme
MLGRLKFLFFYFLSWIVFFEIARLIFFLYHFGKTKSLSITTFFQSFFYGLRMDLSMAAYIILPVCFFILLSVFIAFFRKPLLYKMYTAIILFFVLLIITSDLELYGQWGFRMDATPLKYLSSPKEAWASISHLPVFWIFLLFIIVYASIVWLFNRMIGWIHMTHADNRYKILSALLVLVFSFLLIIPLRGGLQLAPINQSSVYFSTNNFANHAAINATWNFLHGVLNKTSATENPYKFLPRKQAQKIVDSLYQATGNFEQVIGTENPNVILIIWESFTDKVTHISRNGTEVTPNFNELKKEGIYFSNIYASGDRTDKGLPAILSGYPALHSSSILRSVNKSVKLPVLSKYFKARGYSTPFYYGGEPAFANIKSYLANGGFDKIIEKNDFASKDLTSKWGAHDGVVAARFLKDLETSSQPFFATWLTLSSHEPFETPVDAVFKGKDHASQFINSMHYSDYVIKELVAQCKQKPWWINTILIIIADHGHPLPVSTSKESDFKIPMLWLGGALVKKGIVIDKIASQVDLATTLTAQIDSSKKNDFPFGKNIFDKTSKQWAFFNFNNGFGFIQPQKTIVFDNVGKQVIGRAGSISSTDLNAGKALQQVFYQDYLDK